MGLIMDKRIIDLIADFAQWKGDTYRLASLISELQKEVDREKLVDYPEAAGLL
jgi:hypothetical protein